MQRPLWLVLLLIVALIGTAFFAQIEPVEYESEIRQRFNDVGVAYKWWFVGLCICVNAFITSWATALSVPRERLRKVRGAILEDMRTELFGGEQVSLRITIFRKANWWTARVIWVRIFFMTTWRRLRFKKKNTRMTLSKVFAYRFVHITQRLGTEYRNSRTFFHYNPHTKADCESVAAYVMQTGEIVIKPDLPDMRRYDVKNLRRDGPLPEDVETYLYETYATLATLRRLNVMGRHFLAVPLENPKTSARVGVLVIDSVQDRCPFEEPNTQKRIADYTTMIEQAL